jgi:hypothetical protein
MAHPFEMLRPGSERFCDAAHRMRVLVCSLRVESKSRPGRAVYISRGIAPSFLRSKHTEIREAVSKLINLSELRHISFSHFESDECESLNDWLAAAPKADVICSQVGALVNMNEFIGREARGLADGETFATGKYRFRYCRTRHLSHGWDAWRSLRRNAENPALFGPVPSIGRRRTGHVVCRCCGSGTSDAEGIPGWHPGVQLTQECRNAPWRHGLFSLG